jgi:hypothetical protein
MMGEILDEESVDALMRLSSSGHRAISTLHTNSVCEVPTLRSRQNQPSASVNLPKHFAGAFRLSLRRGQSFKSADWKKKKRRKY